ncbi:ABC transporter substrate-binding protein [Mesorhizobium sp. M7A.F.Ca.US.006.01.1.1]|uniref:ABC transporter substrate-binding protein n=1 Tax=Mesorhizobium sp. M7A.F.Ca.US.006.01.1.1 TaxID=2496707 RepID=UPI000FCA1A79|nr:ABC transporter substrate-binding protein [Mesorhizobium sp. M7A.F.Ca.US.006.01.1.1]RUZ77965.1 ABC transporter substrate-binding protein [Mesorhizobium sp. M7A.F.Ca.US.006.01.1.1]
MIKKLALALFLGMTVPSLADENAVRIGVLTDMSGAFADVVGPGGVEAVRMAVTDFGGTVNGKPIEVVFADDQLKPDVALSILRQWYGERGVDVAMEFTTSTIGLAAQEITRSANKVAIPVGPATSDLYGAKCSPNSVVWGMDNFAFGNAAPKAVVAKGGDKWFLLVTDYTFGHQLQALVTNLVTSQGGKIVGAVRHPLGNPDFSSYLLQAQAEGANVIAFINSGSDMSTSIKQAREFALNTTMQFVAPAFQLPNAIALGLEVGQGVIVTNSVYWDQSDVTRAFSKRFSEKMNKVPTENQFMMYAATMHYLKAVDELGSPTDGKAIVEQMKKMPVSELDFKGRIRKDGRVIYDLNLAEVKTPAESTGPFDLYRLTGKIPGEQAFVPEDKTGCQF